MNTIEQPKIDIPVNANVLWTAIQPIKDEFNRYPPTEYSRDEIQFWGTSILRFDQALAKVADTINEEGMPDVGVYRAKTRDKTADVMNELNDDVVQILQTYPRSAYVGFMSGVLPNLLEVYNDPQIVYTDAQARMTTAIVGGTHGNENKVKQVLTKIPDWVTQSDLIIAHDDVSDSVGALAAFTEFILSKKAETAYDSEFVKKFSTVTDKHEKIDLYTDLIHKMQKANIVIAAPFYKNNLFTELLLQATTQNQSASPYSWEQVQGSLLRHRLDFPDTEWLMGDGLDTDISIPLLRQFISEDTLAHPAVQKLFEHMLESKFRVGSTIKGLIALKQYPEDNGRAYMDLVRWVAAHVESYLKLYIDAYEAHLQAYSTTFASPPASEDAPV